MSLRIDTLTPADWPLMRSLRIAAVNDAPTAFSSTSEQEAAKSDDEWRAFAALRCIPGQSAIFVARNGTDEALGLVRVDRDPAHPSVTHLYSVWVAPAGRGKGVARALLLHAERWARSQGCTSLALDVTQGNIAAERLYESLGFVFTGASTPHEIFPELVMRDMVKPLTMTGSASEPANSHSQKI